jgi:putative ABC transport system permease protein
MPPNFPFPDKPDIWVPVGPLSNQPAWQNRGAHPGLTAIGRLKAGVSLEQARAAMNAIAVRLEQQYPTNRSVRVQITPMLETYVRDFRRALWVLLGAVGVVLLIACVNAANLLLARATLRQREIAVRAALGASRWRVTRQLLTESALLAVMGGALGLLLASWGIKLILAVSPDSIPRVGEINLDGRVLAFTLAVSLLTGIIFGLAPAIQASRVDVQAMLKETARSLTGGRRWLCHGLVITEIALTLVLLAGAGLLLRSFYSLQQSSLGFVAENTLSFRVNLPQEKYAEDQRKINFFHQVMENLRSQPGVQAVAITSRAPLSAVGQSQQAFLPAGHAMPESGQPPFMEATVVSPDYFRALAIPLLRGRYFTEQDVRPDLRKETLQGLTPTQGLLAGLKVMIVDEEFARRHWPNEDAIGKRVLFGLSPSAPVATVVGVVGRVKLDGPTADSNLVQGYFPFLQVPVGAMTFTVRTAVEPEQLIAAARRQVMAADPEQPISQIGVFTQMRAAAVAPQRLNMLLLGLFAAVALALALVGIYGVMSYAVTQRAHEIGLRMALGAQRSDVLKLMIREGMTLTLGGALLGLGGALVLTRLMKTLLFGVSPTDPLTFAAITLLLTLVSLLACWIPARRATKVDPMTALRFE